METQFAEIHQLIRKAKERAYYAINSELINLYWDVGKYVSLKVLAQEWGSSIVKNLSIYIRNHEPNTKGFSPQNIWRMKQFYETYSNNEKLSLLVREISWSNNLLILSKTTTEIENIIQTTIVNDEFWKNNALQLISNKLTIMKL